MGNEVSSQEILHHWTVPWNGLNINLFGFEMKLIWSDENSIQALRNHESALLKFNHVNKIHLSIKGCFLSIFYLGLALSAQNHLHGILRFVIDYQWNLLLPVFFLPSYVSFYYVWVFFFSNAAIRPGWIGRTCNRSMRLWEQPNPSKNKTKQNWGMFRKNVRHVHLFDEMNALQGVRWPDKRRRWLDLQQQKEEEEEGEEEEKEDAVTRMSTQMADTEGVGGGGDFGGALSVGKMSISVRLRNGRTGIGHAAKRPRHFPSAWHLFFWPSSFSFPFIENKNSSSFFLAAHYLFSTKQPAANLLLVIPIDKKFKPIWGAIIKNENGSTEKYGEIRIESTFDGATNSISDNGTRIFSSQTECSDWMTIYQ